jgi:hypothetical protein
LNGKELTEIKAQIKLMESQVKQGAMAGYQPELLILGNPVLIPSMHKFQQKNDLNQKE